MTSETRSLKYFYAHETNFWKESGTLFALRVLGINSCILRDETNFWREALFREWMYGATVGAFRKISGRFIKFQVSSSLSRPALCVGNFLLPEKFSFPFSFLRFQFRHCIGSTAHKTNPFGKGVYVNTIESQPFRFQFSIYINEGEIQIYFLFWLVSRALKEWWTTFFLGSWKRFYSTAQHTFVRLQCCCGVESASIQRRFTCYSTIDLNNKGIKFIYYAHAFRSRNRTCCA